MNDPTSTRHDETVQIKGWCPGAVRPMAASDGLVVRIRPPVGRLDREQAQGLAALAGRWAHPLLELTNRANLQLRGVDPAHHTSLLDALRDLGLVDADAAQEARRNVQVQPFWNEGDLTHGLALRLGQLLASDQAPALPAKFGFVVDTGPVPCLRGAYADVRLERHAGGVLVHADGASHGVLTSPQDAPQRALDLARWFLQAGGAPAGRGRMSALLDRCPLPAEWRQTAVEPVARGRADTPAPGPQAGGHLVGLAFGLLPARALAALGACGALRLTPWRSLLVEGAAPLPDLPELITAPGDARLRVAACTGAPGCEQAAPADESTRALALALAPLVQAGHSLHVSGCPKGCAHPRAATTVLITGQGLDLIWQGTAASAPDRRGLDRQAIEQLLRQQAFFPHAAPL